MSCVQPFSVTTCYTETLLLRLACYEKKNFSFMINCRGSGVIAAAKFVNVKVLYAAKRALKNNNNSKITKEMEREHLYSCKK